MKVLIVKDSQGLTLSCEALMVLEDRGVSEADRSPKAWDTKEFRTNHVVHAVVEKFGHKRVTGGRRKVAIIDIPFDGLEGWTIEGDDSGEWVEEDHRTWS
jgi:hypothetical protein